MITRIKNNKTLAILIAVFVIIGAVMIQRSYQATTAEVITADTWQPVDSNELIPSGPFNIVAPDFALQDTSFWWLEFTIRSLFIIFFCVIVVYLLHFLFEEIKLATIRQIFIWSFVLLVIVPVLAVVVRGFLDDSQLLQGWYNIIHSF